MRHALPKLALLVPLILAGPARAGGPGEELSCKTDGPMSAALCAALRVELDRRPVPGRKAGVWRLTARDLDRRAMRARLDLDAPEGVVRGRPASLDVVDADRLTPGQIARLARALLDNMPPEGN